ncbi:MAG: amidase domain-containing protein [Lutisporaceae bacterium]
MKIPIIKKIKSRFIKLAILIALILLLSESVSVGVFHTVFNIDEEIVDVLEVMFRDRNQAIITGDVELIKAMYNTESKYGNWAYEYELRKVKYINNWGKKQGVIFIEINPTLVVRSVKDKEEKIAVNLMCSTEYKYVYGDTPDQVNTFRIGTYHILDLIEKDEAWIITKEWYTDPFADSLNLERINVDSINEYIISQGTRDLSEIGERRIGAVEYADKYCGAASEEQFDFKYNKAYKNYNPQGGDCANFASQVLYVGGKFKKTNSWSYDKNGATRAWVNADGFKSYWLNSGRASVIAYGSYEKVYKASYKLLPGDFIAYEKKGDITHISVVTGADSKGYSLVTCHNTDRNKVPWDLGWSNSNIRFWLIHVHF